MKVLGGLKVGDELVINGNATDHIERVTRTHVHTAKNGSFSVGTGKGNRGVAEPLSVHERRVACARWANRCRKAKVALTALSSEWSGWSPQVPEEEAPGSEKRMVRAYELLLDAGLLAGKDGAE